MSDSLIVIGATGANIASLCFALERLGVAPVVSIDAKRITAAERVILPGVGAAADAMQRLRDAKLDELIPALTQPLLGICLGMQLLFDESAEGNTACLGIINSRVEKLSVSADLTIPHMGWNELEDIRTPLFDSIDNGAYTYFVHSYAAPVGPYTIATATYGSPFSAAVASSNFFGTQFHPEKSAQIGAKILKNFLTL